MNEPNGECAAQELADYETHCSLDELFGSAPTDPHKINHSVKSNSCPEPGIYHNIPSAEYHGWDAISSTYVKHYAALPATSRKPYVPGDDANVGSGVHAFSLQGQAGLDAECYFGPDFGKGKRDQAERVALQLEHPNKTILPAYYGSPAPGQPIMNVLQGVDDSLRSHPKIGPVLANSQKEVSLIWIDSGTGRKCKARLDIWDGAIIWDLKKVKKLSAIRWEMDDGLFYRLQAGMYTEGAIRCGLPAVGFGFIPIEAFPPYQVACGYCDPDKLKAAQENARRLIGLIDQSEKTGKWPKFRIPEHAWDLDDIEPDDLIQLY